MKKVLFTILCLIALFGCKCQSGFLGFQKSTLHNLFVPTPGTLIVTDTQTVNGTRSWSQEGSIFFDSASNSIKVMFTGGHDSLGSSAFVNRIWQTSTTNFSTWTTPNPIIGMGFGGAPSTRRTSSSWSGKIGTKYYCLTLNGYPTIVYTGQDANIYGYTSTDGVTWADQGMKINKATAWSGGALVGFGNIGVCTDQYNTPVVIGGKYVAIVDAWNGSVWVDYRATADSLMGNWTLTDSVPSMQVHTGGLYGGGGLIYYKGTYFIFYHYCPLSGNLPSYLAFAYSTDCINWTKKEYPFFDNTYNPYGNLSVNQIADPFVSEINGKVYLIAEYTNGNSPYPGQIRIWTYNGTFQDLITQLF